MNAPVNPTANQTANQTANRPTVSVIMAVRNGARFLKDALASVHAQTYRPHEVLIIDGHSTDQTAAIAQADAQVTYRQQSGRGIADAYNCGLAAAQGELVAFLSHDDRWTPDKLAAQVECLQQNPAVQFMTAHVKFFLEPGAAIPPGFRRELLDQEPVAHIMETLLARRTVFDRVGGFDPKLSTGEDVDWFARAKDLGVPQAVVPRVLLHKRVHEENASLTTAENDRNLLLALKRSLERKRAQQSK